MAVFCIAANWFHNLSPFAQFRHDLALRAKKLPQRVFEYTITRGTLWMLFRVD
jgi:hypothetical protein